MNKERQKYTVAKRSASRDMLFADYMLYWLRIIKPDVELVTYSGYKSNIENRIVPYFKTVKIKLGELKATDIQEFYTYCRTELGVSNNTVIHYHANISAALNYAFEKDLIMVNPIAKVKRPKHIVFRFLLCDRGDGTAFLGCSRRRCGVPCAYGSLLRAQTQRDSWPSVAGH